MFFPASKEHGRVIWEMQPYIKICLCSLRNMDLFLRIFIFSRQMCWVTPHGCVFKTISCLREHSCVPWRHATMFKKICSCSPMKMVVFFKELFLIKTNVLNCPLGLCSLGKCLFMKQIHWIVPCGYVPWGMAFP
jgi:hypothetical protein